MGGNAHDYSIDISKLANVGTDPNFNSINFNGKSVGVYDYSTMGYKDIDALKNSSFYQTLVGTYGKDNIHLDANTNKIYINGNNNEGFLQKYGNAINTSFSGLKLGLDVLNFFQNKNLIRDQRNYLKAQTTALKANTQHMQSEWDKVNKARERLAKSYNND